MWNTLFKKRSPSSTLSVQEHEQRLKTHLARQTWDSSQHTHELIKSLRELVTQHPTYDFSKIQPELLDWYARHPLTVHWKRGYDVRVQDPLAVELDDVFFEDEYSELMPWASLLRTVVLTDGGKAFHHGMSAQDALLVLRRFDDVMRVENLFLPAFVDWTDADLGALCGHIAYDASMQNLVALRFPGQFQPGHLVALANSRPGETLRVLDVCEVLLDVPEHARREVFEEMGAFQCLVHLNMYNNITSPQDLEVLCSHAFEHLTHLGIGYTQEPALCQEILMRRQHEVFPNLQYLYICSVSTDFGRWAGERGIELSGEVGAVVL